MPTRRPVRNSGSRRFVLFAFVASLCAPTAAVAATWQDPPAAGAAGQGEQPQQQQEPAPQDPGPQSQTMAAVRSLVPAIEQKQQELQAARSEGAGADRIAELQRELAQLETNFDSLVTGLDRAQLEGEAPQSSLVEELESLLRPLVDKLKDLTEEPRQLQRLHTLKDEQARRAQLAQGAIESIGRLLARAEQAEVRRALEAARLRWDGIRAEAVRNQTVAQAQIDQRERDRGSILESATDSIEGFFRSTGLHLLLALLAFAAVFVTLRLTTRRVLRALRPARGGRSRPFYFRVVRIAYNAAIVVLAVVAALMVFYAAGDWVLLGLAILFLVGLAWAAKNTLPRLVEEMRMLLNLGPVREGERVVFEGLPWRVDSISVYSKLSNPALSGGRIRLPLRDLVGLHSRPSQDKEVWFPCSEGDWVRLGDGTLAKVLSQTPEMVQLVKLGGSRVTWPTADFLAGTPENLSADFRLAVTFGVDYRHQAICTTEIPRIMQARLQQALAATLGEDKVIRLVVEFKAAGASSLDYAILADLDGEVAARFQATQRLVQKTLVDVCNEQGWVIPFTQITVHQAG